MTPVPPRPPITVGHPPGHPDRSPFHGWKGHGPDPARWTCCRELVDGPHADSCEHHTCRHADALADLMARHAALLARIDRETTALPSVRRRILDVEGA